MIFRVGDVDARSLESGLSFFEARDLQNLETGQAICRIEKSNGDFNLSIIFDGDGDEATERLKRQNVIAVSRKKYGTSRKDIEEALFRDRATGDSTAQKETTPKQTEVAGETSTPIVTEELWNRCNEILDNPRQRLGPKPVHLFAGILQCGCGAKMYVQARSPKYVCLKCRNKISIEDMETTFREELEDFFVSKQKIKQHLASANRHLTEKKEQLAAHTKQIEKVRGEMKKVYQLFQTDSVTPETFGKLYRPLEEQDKALSAELPRLQGEIDALEVHQISGADVISEATQLHTLWPRFDVLQKRRIIESIVEKIVVSRTEINVTYWSAPSSEELTKEQRHLKAAGNTGSTSNR